MTKCYMCDDEAKSSEHIPPKCLFPEIKDLPEGFDLRKNLIKVPSCDEHNLKKSGDDEYLLFVLACNISINNAGLHHWATKIRRAMQKRPTKKRIFKELKPIVYNGTYTATFNVDIERLNKQFDHIARGIYYHHFHERWIYPIDIFIPFAIDTSPYKGEKRNKSMNDITHLMKSFVKEELKFGDNPEIFFYQLKSEKNPDRFALRMVFYGGLEVVTFSMDVQENENS